MGLKIGISESTKLLLPFFFTCLCNGICYYGATGCQITIFESLSNPINGYYTQMVFCICSTLGPFTAPLLLNYCGFNLSLIIWSLCMMSMSATLIYPTEYTVYICNAIGGWAQVVALCIGNFVISSVSFRYNSSEARNSGLWNLSQMASVLVCNISVFIVFNGKSHITASDRYAITIPFTVIGLCGCFGALFLGTDILPMPSSNLTKSSSTSNNQLSHPESQQPVINDSSHTVEQHFSSKKSSVLLREILKSFTDWRAVFLYSTGLYLGMEANFVTGISQACVGNSMYINNSKEIMGVMGLAIGLGEIGSTLVFSLFSSKDRENGPFTLMYLASGVMGHYLLFLYLPQDSLQHETYELPYCQRFATTAVVSAGFLMGFADAMAFCQFTSIFCRVFNDEDDSPYFTTQCVMIGVGGSVVFFVSSSIDIYSQIFILVSFTWCSALVNLFMEMYAMGKIKAKEIEKTT